MSSGFRTDIRKYWIYSIVDDITETVFVGKTYSKHPKDQYYSHMRGEHALTKDVYAVAHLTEPSFVILECRYCTGRIAFKHVLAWYYYFEERGYAILTDEKTGAMVDSPGYETQKIYETVCAPYTLREVLTREVKDPLPEQEDMQENRQENEGEEALVQMNIRVKESVKQSFRTFCNERDLTQSEGLRLLLLGEDFVDRDLMMQSYQQELNTIKAENAKLKEQNKELLALQREKESWALRNRNEWIRIAKTIVRLIVERFINPRLVFELCKKPFSFKSKEGYDLFSSHHYPQEGGCFEVTIGGLVYGMRRENNSPEKNVPLFVCGKLKDKTTVKFRWYPKKEFIGIPPSNNNIFFEGVWLLGSVIAKDGAADLICAVPLCGIGHINPSRFDMEIDAKIEEELQAIENEIDAEVEAELLVRGNEMKAEMRDMENKNSKPKLDTQIAVANRKKRIYSRE